MAQPGLPSPTAGTGDGPGRWGEGLLHIKLVMGQAPGLFSGASVLMLCLACLSKPCLNATSDEPKLAFFACCCKGRPLPSGCGLLDRGEGRPSAPADLEPG